MMIKVFHHLLDNFSSSEICEIKRKGKLAPPSWTNDGYTNAIAFQVDANVKLHETNLDGGSECIYEETQQYKSNGSESPIKITFSKPIEVDANIKYHLIAEGITGDTFFGKNSKKIVSSNDSNPFKDLLTNRSLLANFPLCTFQDVRIEVDANIKYHLIAEGITLNTYYGKNYKKIVSSNDSNPFKVTFFVSDHHTGSKSESFGQFPTLYFSRCKTK